MCLVWYARDTANAPLRISRASPVWRGAALARRPPHALLTYRLHRTHACTAAPYRISHHAPPLPTPNRRTLRHCRQTPTTLNAMFWVEGFTYYSFTPVWAAGGHAPGMYTPCLIVLVVK